MKIDIEQPPAIVRPYEQVRTLEAIEAELEIVHAKQEQNKFDEGRLLKEIRDNKSYTEATFEKYLAARWPELHERRAYERMDAFESLENLRSQVRTSAVANTLKYSQALLLSTLGTGDQIEFVVSNPGFEKLSVRNTEALIKKYANKKQNERRRQAEQERWDSLSPEEQAQEEAEEAESAEAARKYKERERDFDNRFNFGSGLGSRPKLRVSEAAIYMFKCHAPSMLRRGLAKLYHPDSGGSNESMQTANEVVDVLLPQLIHHISTTGGIQ